MLHQIQASTLRGVQGLLKAKMTLYTTRVAYTGAWITYPQDGVEARRQAGLLRISKSCGKMTLQKGSRSRIWTHRRDS